MTALRVARLGGARVVVLMIGAAVAWAGQACSHCTAVPEIPGSEEQQGERHDSAASEKRGHGQEHRPRSTGAKGRN